MIENILQGITLRKYNSAFIEAWGMIPITFMGAVGDNRTDNYGNLQVAIDEAIRRKVRYLYVPQGTYYYSGNLLHLDKVAFVGNGTSRIYKKQGEVETDIEIHQLGLSLPWLNGSTDISSTEDITEEGHIDIPINLSNPIELYLSVKTKGASHTPITIEDVARIKGQVLHVTEDKTIFGNMIYGPEYDIAEVEIGETPPISPNRIALSNKTVNQPSAQGVVTVNYLYISSVELQPNNIRINYTVENNGGKFNKILEWSVR